MAESSGSQKLSLIEVEVELLPGLPGIQFLGLPDQHVKESALRIKSAIKLLGFEFPKARQIVVNLRPSHIKKSSRGLELAVVAAYLWKTKQISKPVDWCEQPVVVYGELNLTGQVFAPEDLTHFCEEICRDKILITGVGSEVRFSKEHFQIETLKDFEAPKKIKSIFESQSAGTFSSRPQKFHDWIFKDHMAELLQVVTLGRHSVLLAGAHGTGKTTFAEVVHALLPESNSSDWWPWSSPHHSIPRISLVGGGSQIHGGELSLAHHGVLLLDEFLEFKSEVLEALREPLEREQLVITRHGERKTYPFQSHIIATTNLCPCGKWTPRKKVDHCVYSERRCRSVLEKLSAPLLDRFQVMFFFSDSKIVTKKLNSEAISGVHTFQDILKKVESVREFQKDRVQRAEPENSIESVTVNAVASEKELVLQLKSVPENWFDSMSAAGASFRRRTSTLRVARTLADMDMSPLIHTHHLEKAMKWTEQPFWEIFNLR